jgi:hypothetical protein
MKKTILALAFAATGMAAYAQKPVAGDKTAEFNLMFQTGTAPVSYGLGSTSLPGTPELRLRYFMADDMAIRLKLGLGMATTTSEDVATIGGTDVTAETKTNSGFNLGIAPGIEKHFAGTTRLSPYVGAELPIGFGTGATTEITNSNDPSGSVTGTGDAYKNEAGSQFRIGLNLVLGADYYIVDGLYLGVEGGLGIFNMTSTGEGKETITTAPVAPATDPAVAENITGKSSSMALFGAFSTGVRLGYKF